MSPLKHLSLIAVSLVVQTTLAQPVPGEIIDSAWNEFETVWHQFRDGEAEGTDLIAAHETHIEPLPFERFSSKQLADLPFMAVQFGTAYDRVTDRLEHQLANNPNDLHALIKYLELLRWAGVVPTAKDFDSTRERRAGLLGRILTHPDLAQAVADTTAKLIPANITVYDDSPEGLRNQRQAIDILAALLDHEAEPFPLTIALADHWDTIKALGYGPDSLAQLRATLLPRVQATHYALQAQQDKSLAQLQLADDAQQALGYMTSPNAMRDILGAPAPALDILWSSDPSISSFEDLAGKPLLLEFWVTGCLHCIAAIPELQALADRYQSTDLQIVAVTSLQGRHYDPDQASQIDTAGDPDLEHQLMAQFIESQGITWPVVFTAQSAWNPDYEVRGTPHMTLIDPDGNIAANDMHPQLGLAANSQRIDAMLQAFGLSTPNPVPASDD